MKYQRLWLGIDYSNRLQDSFTGLIISELMFVIIGLMMAPGWFIESNDVLKDTIAAYMTLYRGYI